MTRSKTQVLKKQGLFKYKIEIPNSAFSSVENVKCVRFDISRYGKYEAEQDFAKPLTVMGAIRKVEEFLSGPLTQEYYERVKDDTFHEFEWDRAQNYFKCRGAVLTDAIHLEGFNVDHNGVLRFSIGS
jgi:hypothetical protein